jgi:uncharacterized protein YndB with AHSA1/START domain
MTYGTVTNFEDSATVRFERRLATPVETVWHAITDEQSLAAWLAPTQLDGRVGGAVHVDFGDGQVQGIVTVFEPPHTLEYTWTFTGEPDSTLRISLTPTSSGTELVLEHRLLPSDQAPGYGAGWHAHLDMLGSTVEGTAAVDWDERFNAVLGSYAGA